METAIKAPSFLTYFLLADATVLDDEAEEARKYNGKKTRLSLNLWMAKDCVNR